MSDSKKFTTIIKNFSTQRETEEDRENKSERDLMKSDKKDETIAPSCDAFHINFET